jgi:hypothetical protein
MLECGMQIPKFYWNEYLYLDITLAYKCVCNLTEQIKNCSSV